MKKNLLIALSLLCSGAMLAQQPTLPGAPGSVLVDLTLEESPAVGATLTGAGTYNNGETVNFSATAPTGYHFVKWNDNNTDASRSVTLTEHATFVANFAINQYEIVFEHEDGTALQTTTEDYGTTPAYNGAEPTKAGNAQYSYTFSGWTPAIATVTEDATYTATFTQTVNEYLITFLDEDGTTLQSSMLAYGATPACADPSKAATAQYSYTFNGWSPAVATVTGEATYTATYSQTVNRYTLGVAAEECSDTLYYTYDYGTEIEIEAVANTGNHFIAWSDGSTDNPRTLTIVSDTIVVALFGPDLIEIPVEANAWKYIAFPVDVPLSEISYEGNGYWAKYNGEDRATYGRIGWEFFADGETTLAANTGYIFQSDIKDTLRVNIMPDTLPQGDITIALAEYTGSHVENDSWNFIGNPYYADYNIAGIAAAGYTSPLYTWNGLGYSIRFPENDNFTFNPFEAFFVQRPADVAEIGFDNTYRIVPSSVAARRAPQMEEETTSAARKFIDLYAATDSYSDRARLILDENAAVRYEAGRDAVKFFSETAPVEIYFIDEAGIQCAAYERPMADTIAVGYKAALAGNITISVSAMDEKYILLDAATGMEINLTEGDYTFAAEQGTNNVRFKLVKSNSAIVDDEKGYQITPDGLVVTGEDLVHVYSPIGQLLAEVHSGETAYLAAGTYVVTCGQSSNKIIIR